MESYLCRPTISMILIVKGWCVHVHALNCTCHFFGKQRAWPWRLRGWTRGSCFLPRPKAIIDRVSRINKLLSDREASHQMYCGLSGASVGGHRGILYSSVRNNRLLWLWFSEKNARCDRTRHAHGTYISVRIRTSGCRVDDAGQQPYQLHQIIRGNDVN